MKKGLGITIGLLLTMFGLTSACGTLQERRPPVISYTNTDKNETRERSNPSGWIPYLFGEGSEPEAKDYRKNGGRNNLLDFRFELQK